MSNLLVNIKELVSFYIQVNYDEYLKKENLKEIPEDKITDVINSMFDSKKDHMIKFVKTSLKDVLGSEYPEDRKIDVIFNEILEDKDYCINRLSKEIITYQKQKK